MLKGNPFTITPLCVAYADSSFGYTISVAICLVMMSSLSFDGLGLIILNAGKILNRYACTALGIDQQMPHWSTVRSSDKEAFLGIGARTRSWDRSYGKPSARWCRSYLGMLWLQTSSLLMILI